MNSLKSIASLTGPIAWPFVGNLLSVRPDRIHQNFEAWARKYGDLFRVYFGRQAILVVAGHKEVAAVLKERPDGFRRPSITANVSMEMGGTPGLFLAEGLEWRNQRRMVMAGFAPGPIKAYFSAINKVALRLEKRWQASAEDSKSIDLSGDLKRYTVDIIAGLAFGTEVNTLEAGEDVIQQHLDVVLPAVARRSIALFPYWRYFKLPQDRRLDRSVAALRLAIDDLIRVARLRMQSNSVLKDKPSNLLEAMIVAADTEGSGVDDIAVAGNVSTLLLAGEDTTANTIAWIIYLLHHHPDQLARVTREISQSAPDSRAFSLDQMDSLVYLEAVIQEAMRLKPVAPIMPFEATRDVAVGDVSVPKGTIVWCILRHDSVSDEYLLKADQFQPERWLGDDTANLKKVSIPFGSGPRTCPGRYLAMLEIKVALAMLLSRFKIDAVNTPDGKPAQELMAFVMSPVGLSLQLSVRPSIAGRL
jgi:cytochrome P450